jgi:hypothetical protein
MLVVFHFFCNHSIINLSRLFATTNFASEIYPIKREIFIDFFQIVNQAHDRNAIDELLFP